MPTKLKWGALIAMVLFYVAIWASTLLMSGNLMLGGMLLALPLLLLMGTIGWIRGIWNQCLPTSSPEQNQTKDELELKRDICKLVIIVSLWALFALLSPLWTVPWFSVSLFSIAGVWAVTFSSLTWGLPATVAVIMSVISVSLRFSYGQQSALYKMSHSQKPVSKHNKHLQQHQTETPFFNTSQQHNAQTEEVMQRMQALKKRVEDFQARVDKEENKSNKPEEVKAKKRRIQVADFLINTRQLAQSFDDKEIYLFERIIGTVLGEATDTQHFWLSGEEPIKMALKKILEFEQDMEINSIDSKALQRQRVQHDLHEENQKRTVACAADVINIIINDDLLKQSDLGNYHCRPSSHGYHFEFVTKSPPVKPVSP